MIWRLKIWQVNALRMHPSNIGDRNFGVYGGIQSSNISSYTVEQGGVTHVA